MKAQIGLPVQYVLTKRKEHIVTREVFAGVIIDIIDYPQSIITIRVFTKNNNPPSYVEYNVRHKDFERGEDSYWDFLDLED